MLTEAEAKTKWCPHVRYLATFRDGAGKLETAGSFNRGGADSGLEKSNCIGSACMMWRWDAEEDGLKKPMRVNPLVLAEHWKGWTVTNSVPDEQGYVEISPPPPKKATGFCGLAGRPK